MFDSILAKSWMVRHIRDLFRMRPNDLRPTTWTCVVHDGKVSVKKLFMKDLVDQEIMWCSLLPGRAPSWLQTNIAVHRHWSLLSPIAMERWRKSCDDSGRTPVQQAHVSS